MGRVSQGLRVDPVLGEISTPRNLGERLEVGLSDQNDLKSRLQ